MRTITTPPQLKQMVEDYLDFDEWVFDVETLPGREPRFKKDQPQGDPTTNQVFWISFAGPGRADVVPMGHPTGPPQLARTEAFELLRPMFFSGQRKINQNIKFDLRSIAKYYKGEIPPPPYGETIVLTHVLNENLGPKGYKLGPLVERYLKFSYEKLGELGVERFGFDEAAKYSYLDAKMTWLLWRKLRRSLLKHPDLVRVFDLEMDVLEVLCHMESVGALVDPDGFELVDRDLRQRLAGIKSRTFEQMGCKINFGSTQQKARYLFKDLKLRPKMYTKTGQPQVSEQALKPFARKVPAVKGFLEYTTIKKLHSTYVEGMIPRIDDDNRVRASFRQAGTVTGRFSCGEPNLQNIPVRAKAEGNLIRNLFIAPPGWSLVVADYSMIELVVLAHYSQDKRLLKAFRQGLDLHSYTAALMKSKPIEEVDVEERALGKKCNFLLGYGGQWQLLASAGDMSDRAAKEAWKQWHKSYPAVSRWTEATIDIAHQQGYVTTVYGRKRRLPQLKSFDESVRRRSERMGVNTVIQGSAADIMKLAMVQVYQAWEPWWDWKMTLTVHDELMHEVPEDQVEAAVPLIRDAMENITKDGEPLLTVPLKAGIEVVKRWSDAK